QADGRFVLAIQDSAGFFQGFANLRERLVLPTPAGFRIGLEVLSLGGLPRQARLAQPSPNRVFGNVEVQMMHQHCMQTAHGPQVGLKSEFRCRRQDDVFEAFGSHAWQLSGPTADRPTLQPLFAVQIVPYKPAMQRRSIDAIRGGSMRNWHSVSDCFDCTNAYVHSRIPVTVHGLKTPDTRAAGVS